jgi:hypothetical protein
MSRRDFLSNKLFVTIEVPFDDAWSDLSADEQEEFVTSNIGMIDTDELIAELEHRGYVVKEEGEDGNE